MATVGSTISTLRLLPLQPVAPVVVAIGGLMGTGKTTLARAFAPELGPAPGALVLRSDEVRKRLQAVRPEVRLPTSAYDLASHRRTDAALLANVRDAVAGRHAVVVDATFLDPGLRERVAAVARAAGGAVRGPVAARADGGVGAPGRGAAGRCVGRDCCCAARRCRGGAARGLAPRRSD